MAEPVQKVACHVSVILLLPSKRVCTRPPLGKTSFNSTLCWLAGGRLAGSNIDLRDHCLHQGRNMGIMAMGMGAGTWASWPWAWPWPWTWEWP